MTSLGKVEVLLKVCPSHERLGILYLKFNQVKIVKIFKLYRVRIQHFVLNYCLIKYYLFIETAVKKIISKSYITEFI